MESHPDVLLVSLLRTTSWEAYWTHDGGLPVKLKYVSVCPLVERNIDIRTRSSPIGPAEHDEGGSLRNCQYLLWAFVPKGWPRKILPLHEIIFQADLRFGREDAPSEVCEFLVDTLERHCDVLGVLASRRWASSSGHAASTAMRAAYLGQLGFYNGGGRNNDVLSRR
jgi:hypothetical protein